MAEGEVEFGRVESVEEHHFVFVVTQMLETGEDLGHVVEEVAEDEDDSSPAGAAGEFVEHPAEVGWALIGTGYHGPDGFLELADLAGRAEEAREPRRPSTPQADAVRLLKHEIGHRRRGEAGQFVFAARPRPIGHRPAGIEHQPGHKVRFLFVLLEVEAFGAAVDFPVDVADVVAG